MEPQDVTTQAIYGGVIACVPPNCDNVPCLGPASNIWHTVGTLELPHHIGTQHQLTKGETMQVITRKAARESGEKWYFTGKPCKWGHVSKRFVSAATCVSCGSQWYKAHSETITARVKKWQKAHPEVVVVNAKKWRKNNLDLCAALAGKAGAKKRVRGCIPNGFNLQATIPFYAEARELTEETGIDREVDHIYPLAFGGMHEASNLQVLTATENRWKGNKRVSNAA